MYEEEHHRAAQPTLEPPPLRRWSLEAAIRVGIGGLIAGGSGAATAMFALYLVALSTRPPNSPTTLLYALPIVFLIGGIPTALGAWLVRAGLRLRDRQQG